MELKFCEKSFMLTLTLPAKHGEGSKSKRVRAVFARSGTWLTLNQEQFKKLLEDVYRAGEHAGLMYLRHR
jgi:coproporphyrinogen III oxidase-like Fe-S oxidoreductase